MNNDRFKFRVWDIFDALFCDNHISIRSDGEYFNFQTGRIVKDSHREHFIIMQCTGIKDKNDTLIYEGDIIAAHFPFDGELSAHSNKFYVKWIGYDEITTYSKNLMENKYPFAATPGFYLFNDNYKHRPFVFSDSDGVTYEVIGNIYENYDLLEKK